MKNNNPYLKYILIAAAAVIWGLIIYKVIKGLKQDDIVVPVIKKEIVNKDTIQSYTLLDSYYPNPFNKELPIEIQTYSSKTSSSITNQIPNNSTTSMQSNVNSQNVAPVPQQQINGGYAYGTPTPAEVVPVVKYTGYIYNPQTKKRTALILIGGKTIVVGALEKIDNIQIRSIAPEELVYTYKGKKITVNIGG